MSRDVIPWFFGLSLTAGAIHAQAQYICPDYWSTGPIRFGFAWTQPYYGYPYPRPTLPALPGAQDSGGVLRAVRPAPQPPVSAPDLAATLQRLTERLSALERRMERLEMAGTGSGTARPKEAPEK
jgi:hypothetical protein